MAKRIEDLTTEEQATFRSEIGVNTESVLALLAPADDKIYAFRNGLRVPLKPETEWLVFATHVTDVSNWAVIGGTPLLDSNGNVTFDTPETVTQLQVVDGLTAASVVNASVCPALTGLDLSGGVPITTPPILSGLSSLVSLYLQDTGITTPPVLAGLTSLAELILSNTDITTTPVLTGLSSLSILDLSNTDITTPPALTGLSSLYELRLNNTNLTTPPVLTGLSSLYQLDLGGCPITTPPVLTGLGGLYIIGLGGTDITTPPTLTGLSYLYELDLQNTPITAPPIVTGLGYLQFIYLNGTAITSVTAINDFFNQLDTAASVMPTTDGYVEITGGSAAPTAPSLTARNHLAGALNWTVITN